jgi:hypothetical protein
MRFADCFPDRWVEWSTHVLYSERYHGKTRSRVMSIALVPAYETQPHTWAAFDPSTNVCVGRSGYVSNSLMVSSGAGFATYEHIGSLILWRQSHTVLSFWSPSSHPSPHTHLSAYILSHEVWQLGGKGISRRVIAESGSFDEMRHWARLYLYRIRQSNPGSVYVWLWINMTV